MPRPSFRLAMAGLARYLAQVSDGLAGRKGGAVRLPIVNTASQQPAALGGLRLPQDGLPGFGTPLPPGVRPLVPPQRPAQAAPAALESQTAGRSPAFQYDYALTTEAMGFHTAAIEALQDCTARAPNHAPAWRKLAALLRLCKEDAEAEACEAAARRATATGAKWKPGCGERTRAKLIRAETELRESLHGTTADEATEALRARLFENPLDAPSLRVLAQLERQHRDFITARTLLERALDLSPAYIGARMDYAGLLIDRRAHALAVPHLHLLLEDAPRNQHYRTMYAHAMSHTGDFAAAVETLTGLVQEFPRHVGHWLHYAQCLHYMGRREESVQAYRTCIELQPDMGEAYWGLADMKGNFITAADIEAIRFHLASDTLERGRRMHMLYALAPTLERAGDYAASFAAYEQGALLARATARDEKKGYEPDIFAQRVRRTKEVFSRENFARLAPPSAASAPADTPIFVVGMPRAGSTLVEQILASHSLVEGTRELPIIGDITRTLAHSRLLVTEHAYPECVLDMSAAQLAELGARYFEGAARHRTTKRLYFVDKRPWNWLDAGLIRMILPHAKIIDIRREPMAACFAMYKQLLPHDASFTYDFDDLGDYYNKYVGLMEHWKQAMPGHVHFVQYEHLVENTESEIRRMLDYCGLPFEEGCLRFWENDRAVVTPSAEQVRRPIFRSALEQWRNFEPWLTPLKEALARQAE